MKTLYHFFRNLSVLAGTIAFILTIAPDTTHAQNASSDKDLGVVFKQVDRFFEDWRRTRKPLTNVIEEDLFLRTLVLDDLSSVIKRFGTPVGLDTPQASSPATRSLRNQVAAGITRLQGSNAFPIVLRPADEPRIGHTDCGVDYQCTCDTEHKYIAITIPEIHITHPRRRAPSPEDLVKVWQQVPPGQIYACYEKHNHFEGFAEQRYCRFISRISRESNPELLERLQSDQSLSRIPKDRLIELVVESSVRVSPRSNLPIDRPSDYVRPVYGLTDSEVYLFDEIYAQPRIRCALAKLFDRPVFSVSGCRDKNACTKAAVEMLIRQLDRVMSAPPILAAPDQTDASIPGERTYIRNYERSEVLGQPFFESSQYIAKWYRNEGGRVSPPGLYTYSKGAMDHIGDYVFVNLRQSLSVRAGRNGPYPEATRQQYAAYQKAVANLLVLATTEVCSSLSGKMINSETCNLEDQK